MYDNLEKTFFSMATWIQLLVRIGIRNERALYISTNFDKMNFSTIRLYGRFLALWADQKSKTRGLECLLRLQNKSINFVFFKKPTILLQK